MSFNVLPDGPGVWHLEYIRDVILSDVFPRTQFVTDQTKPANLIVRHYNRPVTSFDVPYVAVCGEPEFCTPNREQRPIFFLDTCKESPEPESIWCPLLAHDILVHFPVDRPIPNPEKKWCCAYAFGHAVVQREVLFRRMRSKEPTCYGFGRCSHTTDNPFVLPRSGRDSNRFAFRNFAFNVAMENSVRPGYVTEKIGHAFASGSVPIYWGDTETVNDFFNPDAFLNVGNFSNSVQAADFAIELWRDKQKLQRYLDAPVTLNNRVSDYAAKDYRPWKKPLYDAFRDAFPDLS